MKKIVYYSLISIPFFYIIYYYFIIFIYSENIPFIDDYAGVLDFTYFYINTTDFGRIIHFIFRQHNEHRIAFSRLIMIISYHLFEEINLKYLILISSLNLVLLFTIMSKAVLSYSKSILSLIPLIFITFHFQHHGNIFWAESSLQNLSVACVGIASIWFGTKESSIQKFISLILAFFVTFSSGGGLSIWIVFWILYIIKSQWKWVMIYIAGGLVSYIIFLINYERSGSLLSSTFSIVKYINDILGTFGLLGGWIDFKENGSNVFAVIIGIITSATIILPILKKILQKISLDTLSLFLLGCFLYIAASALIINLGRDAYTENRYKIISTISLILTYISLHRIYIHDKRYFKVQLLMIASAIFYCFLTGWWYIPEIQKHRQTLLAELQVIMSYPNTIRTETYATRLNNLRKLGAWHPPIETLASEFEPFPKNQPLLLNKSIQLNNSDDEISIKYKDNTSGSQNYMYAISNDYEFYLPLNNERHSFIEFIQTGRVYSDNFKLNIYKSWLTKGDYYIGIYNSSNREYQFLNESKIKIVKSSPNWLTAKWFNDDLPL